MQFDTVQLRTSDGLTLHGDLVLPTDHRGAAVVCHPHPLYGGDRFNPVVQAVADACIEAGLATIRFDFRGVNMSEGKHGGGTAEQLDVRAALALAGEHRAGGMMLLAGYSFGSMMALGVADPGIDAWLAVAPPLGMIPSAPASAHDHRPKCLVVPEHDQYSPPAATAEKSADWVNTTMVTVQMGDHFLAGRLAEVTQHSARFIAALAGR